MFVIKSATVPRVLSGSPITGIHVEIDIIADFLEVEPAEDPETDASFDVRFDDSTVGSATISSMLPLSVGANSRTVKMNIRPDAEDAAAVLATRTLVSKFGAGEPIDITLANGNLSAANSTRTEAFQTAAFPIPVPGNKTKIVELVTAFFPPNPFTMTISGNVKLTNPFDCEFDVLRLKGECKYDALVIGTINATFGVGEVRIASRSM
ncbi:hypothetical protein HDU98_009315, partial [Podochytrium sp. JEL0797]